MNAAQMSESPEFHFGWFRLDPVRRVLFDGDAPSKLGARALDLLLVLVQHRDRVVGKNELFDLVWPGLVVEENNLQQHISALRKLLGPQAIVTVPGRGYRFVLPLDATSPMTAPTAAASVCKRLGGIPLAIELAAARVSLLGVADLHRRLHDSFRVLANDRSAWRRAGDPGSLPCLDPHRHDVGPAFARQVDTLSEATQPEQRGSFSLIDRGAMPGQHLHLGHRALDVCPWPGRRACGRRLHGSPMRPTGSGRCDRLSMDLPSTRCRRSVGLAA